MDDREKKAKLAYLTILSGKTDSGIQSIGPLAKIRNKEKKQMKKIKK